MEQRIKCKVTDYIDTLKQSIMEVHIQEINGILYYIDKNNNVYKTEDILCNSKNPRIIAKYGVENGIYKFIYIYDEEYEEYDDEETKEDEDEKITMI